MRLGALAVLALVAAACGPQASATLDAARPASAASGEEAQLFSMDKGFLFPIVNGARVPIENGWIEPHISPFPPRRSADVDIVVVADGTDASDADVTLSYEMLEMAHGATTVKPDAGSGGHHVAHMAMGMYGTWRITVRVVLGGVTSTTVLVLTGAGL